MHNATDNNSNAMLRAAIGRLVEQSAPATGWERRVMRAAAPRRRRLRLLWPSAAAAAAVLALICSGWWRVEGGKYQAKN